MKKFIGREKEISLIGEILKKSSASVLIYGKRKVGKTTLIMQALKSSADSTVYYECLKASKKDNVDNFVNELVKLGVIPVFLSFTSFVDVFAYLHTLGRTLNIVIDEYPYLKHNEKPEIIDSEFQKIIDNYIGNIRLFISGSHIGIMKDMLAESNALYGRFSLIIRLKELNYLEASEFYPEKSVYEKIAFYSVFGGSPYINGFIDSDKSLKQNVVDTILNQNCPVFNYAEHLLVLDFFGSANAENIMSIIANGKKKYGEIEASLYMKNNGLLSKQLTALLNLEIVKKSYPINKVNDKKKHYYELCDNLLRFYYSFVYKNKSSLLMLGPEVFYDEYIEKSVVTFISHRFEEMCRDYFSLCVKSGHLRGITDIGSYYYDDSATHSNGEFDVVLEKHGIYDVYEVKYYSAPLGTGEMLSEAKKIDSIKGLNVGNTGFISACGFENYIPDYDLISGDMLYEFNKN